MSFKTALMAVALAASSFAASALTLTPYQEHTFDTEFVMPGTFSNVYEFDFAWGTSGLVQGSVSELKFGKAKDISFGAGALQVLDANNNVVLSLDGNATGTQFFEIANVLSEPLFIGTSSFKVVITGTVIGAGPGTLGSYDFSIQAAPVPEAQSYAMALAGLGVAGLMMRRRRQG